MSHQNRKNGESGSLKRRFLLAAAGLACLLAGFSGCTGDSNLLGLLADLGRTLPEVPATMSPMSGTIAGGTKVTIRGEGFLPTHVVLFDGQTPASYTVINDGLIEVVTGPHAAGPVNVVLERPNSPSINVAGQFTYLIPADIETPVQIAGVTPASGTTLGGTKVTITGANFKPGSNVLFGGFLGEQTEVVNDQVITSVAPAQAAGKVDVRVLTPDFPATTLFEGFEYLAPELIDNGESPRVVGATSLDNKTVLVTFSKPMGAGAEDKGSYGISGSESAFLVVMSAQLLADKTTVKLTTLTQDFDNYTVHVVGVKDAFGRELATPEGIIAPPAGIDPTRAAFRGTAPTEAEIDFDTDGDAFGDWFEMKGWLVTVRFANGTESTSHVTSDPLSPDTDLDGLDDSVENQYSWDPRTNDTDADHILDGEEFNEWYSDPASQDSDDDGFADPLEIQFFHTSPILADTDGDQWTDDDEVLNRNRNPRRSDIPLPQIRVGEISIFLKETYSYTDERGGTVSDFTAKTSTLSQSSSRTLSTSDTQSSENTDNYSQELGTEFTVGGQDPFGGFKIEAKVGFEQTRQRGYSSTVGSESVQSSSQDFQDSHQFGSTFSENRSFSRTIDDATLSLDVTVSNLGDVAFSISDLELSAFVRDPQRREDVPVGTLLSEVQIQTGQPQTYNLGPFDTDRGPFIFKDIQLFPNVAAELRKSPQAVTVKIANFNIRDESGRLFAFSSQDINDRTAGIIIDYGDGTVEAHRVATANKFDEFGRSRGITMRKALENILGILKTTGDDQPIGNPNDPAVRNSFGTIVGSDNVEILTRIRGVQTTVGGGPRDRKFWAIVSSTALPNGVNFSDTVLRAGTNYSLQFVQDRDSDGLFASTEFIYGCSDDDMDGDTDNDGIGDFDEVRTGWVVGIPGNSRRTFPDPTLVDSDGDGLSDALERAYRTDPRHSDTDEDGIRDNLEVEGYELVVFDGDDDPTNNPVLQLSPYSDEAIIDGGNGVVDTTAAGDDVQAEQPGTTVAPGTPIILPGPNGRLDTTAAGDDFRDFGPKLVAGANGVANTTAIDDDVQLVPPGTGGLSPDTPTIAAGLDGQIDSQPALDDVERAGHEQFFASDPLRRDTDADSLPDGREQFLGSHPNNPKDAGTVVDTDFDGMVDAEEINGWDITVGLRGGAIVEPFAGGNGIANTTKAAGSDDIQVVPVGQAVEPGFPVILPGPDNTLQTSAAADDIRSDAFKKHVTSNKLRADTDNDGLPDLMERYFRLDPNLRDTDGDTYPDRFELDPADPRGYFPIGTFDDFAQRCALADDCSYVPPEASQLIGTNPTLIDTDVDGRFDNIEREVELRVVVTHHSSGARDYQVSSDPFEADADNDSLNDSEEAALGTDPTLRNTDGDVADDNIEANAARGTDPLFADQIVTFNFFEVFVNDDCDDSVGDLPGIELEGGPLKLELPDGSNADLRSFSCHHERCDSDECPDTGETYDFSDVGRVFVLRRGASFRPSSGTFRDKDTFDCAETGYQTVGSFDAGDQVYPQSDSNPEYVAGSGSCQITFRATIRVR